MLHTMMFAFSLGPLFYIYTGVWFIFLLLHYMVNHSLVGYIGNSKIFGIIISNLFF